MDFEDSERGDDASAAAAGLLTRAGAQRGQPIIAVTDAADVLATLVYAAALLKAPFFPIDPALPLATRTALIAQVGPALLVDDDMFPTKRPLSFQCAAPLPYAPRAGPAVLIATSGSTGAPKVVMLSGQNLAASAKASARITPLQPGDAWLACLPLFHIGGFSILTRCAFAGARMILHQGFDADRVADGLSAARVTHLSLTPSMLAQLLALDRRPPSCLRHVLVGGAALSAELAGAANEAGWPIQPTYGMSECSSQLATLPRLSSNWRTGQVGRPLRGAEIGLTPDGRLKTHGPMVMQGYANPGLTPGDGLDEGWFVSNDLAEISPEGALTVLGRADDMIVSGGKKVHPLAIARELAACPGIGDFAIVGRPDPIWGEVVTVAYTGATPCEALLQWSRAHLSSAFRPRAAVRVAALPLLANGKPDRSALREMAERRDAKARALGETQKALG